MRKNQAQFKFSVNEQRINAMPTFYRWVSADFPHTVCSCFTSLWRKTGYSQHPYEVTFSLLGLIMKICNVNLAPATCFKDKTLLVNVTIQMNHFSSAIACLYYLLKVAAF